MNSRRLSFPRFLDTLVDGSVENKRVGSVFAYEHDCTRLGMIVDCEKDRVSRPPTRNRAADMTSADERLRLAILLADRNRFVSLSMSGSVDLL